MGQGPGVKLLVNLCLDLGNFLEIVCEDWPLPLEKNTRQSGDPSFFFTTAEGWSPVNSGKKEYRGGELRGLNCR